jgi:hypothetical protein
MSRTFSDVVKILLSSDNIAIFYLIDIVFPHTTLKHSTLPYTVTIPSLGTYNANSNLKSVEAPRLTNIVDRVSYKVVYADPDFEFKEYFELGAAGSSVTIRLGFFNPLDVEIGGAGPGSPILTPENILVVYKGVIDSHGYVVDDGESIATFECSSPMADLNQKTFYVTTDAEQRKRNPSDVSLENMHLSSEAQTLNWGKK